MTEIETNKPLSYVVGHVPMLRFVDLKIFQSKSNKNSIILIRSCELASKTRQVLNRFKTEVKKLVCHPPNGYGLLAATKKQKVFWPTPIGFFVLLLLL